MILLMLAYLNQKPFTSVTTSLTSVSQCARLRANQPSPKSAQQNDYHAEPSLQHQSLGRRSAWAFTTIKLQLRLFSRMCLVEFPNFFDLTSEDLFMIFKSLLVLERSIWTEEVGHGWHGEATQAFLFFLFCRPRNETGSLCWLNWTETKKVTEAMRPSWLSGSQTDRCGTSTAPSFPVKLARTQGRGPRLSAYPKSCSLKTKTDDSQRYKHFMVFVMFVSNLLQTHICFSFEMGHQCFSWARAKKHDFITFFLNFPFKYGTILQILTFNSSVSPNEDVKYILNIFFMLIL